MNASARWLVFTLLGFVCTASASRGIDLAPNAPDPLRKTLQAAGLAVEVRERKESGIRISLACPKGSVELERGLRREP